jgi:hypothetical protein
MLFFLKSVAAAVTPFSFLESARIVMLSARVG